MSFGPNAKILKPELVIEIQRDMNNRLGGSSIIENLDREKNKKN